MTGSPCGAETAYPSRAHPLFLVLAARSLVFCVLFCRSLFVLFLGATVLSVLRITTLITSLVSIFS